MSVGPAPKRSEFYSTSEYRKALRRYRALLVAEKRADKAFERRFKARQKAKKRKKRKRLFG
jgi:homoserine acetyltransferase